MDKSDLQTMLQFAHSNNLMHKPFKFVYEWYLRYTYLTFKYSLNLSHLAKKDGKCNINKTA